MATTGRSHHPRLPEGRWRVIRYRQSYEIKSTNRRYRTPFRDTALGWALQLAVMFVVVFLVMVRVL